MVADEVPETMLRVMNACLSKGDFPRNWKKAKLVLIPKHSEVEGEKKYRPICMLSTVGKLLERLLCERIRAEVEARGGLSDRQYGFREHKSTTDAVTKVVELTREATKGSYQSKKLGIMISFDVRNAFNSAPWDKIIKALEERQVPAYLIKMVEGYFQDRLLVVGEDQTKMRLSRGVPQGSVLGSLVWNVFYDGVLRLKMAQETETIDYADDLALIVTAKDVGRLVEAANESVGKVMNK